MTRSESQSTPPRPTLEAEFTRQRGDGFELTVSLTVAADETLAVLGPNGAGKSTMVECIAGLQSVDTGVIRLGDAVLDDVDGGVFVGPHQRRLGVVFQDYLLFDHLSVVDNVAFGPRSTGSGTAAANATALDLLAQLEIGELADQSPAKLSGGQRQRVAIARALAVQPDALLLDEPLAALDVQARDLVRRSMADVLSAVPGPRLLITHDPIDAFLLADRIAILESGCIVQTGTADQIRRRPATDYVASLMGTNMLAGHNVGGQVQVEESDLVLHTVHDGVDGPVVVTVAPNAVSLYESRPDGSPRNTWLTTVEVTEHRGEVTRVVLGAPAPLEVDVTTSAAAALDLRPGTTIWAVVKATEIAVTHGHRRP